MRRRDATPAIRRPAEDPGWPLAEVAERKCALQIVEEIAARCRSWPTASE
jgi:hypothetical protein